MSTTGDPKRWDAADGVGDGAALRSHISRRVITDEAAVEQQIIALSAKKWQWMSDRDMPALTALFHPKAVFVHMGGAWGTEQELALIEGGNIHYKNADVHEVSVNVVGTTAILLNKVTLLAVVGGHEVTNLFEVTEAYAQEGDDWKMVGLSFTKLLTQDDPARG